MVCNVNKIIYFFVKNKLRLKILFADDCNTLYYQFFKNVNFTCHKNYVLLWNLVTVLKVLKDGSLFISKTYFLKWNICYFNWDAVPWDSIRIFYQTYLFRWLIFLIARYYQKKFQQFMYGFYFSRLIKFIWKEWLLLHIFSFI